MIAMVTEKLVRDLIPDIIRSNGEDPSIRIAKPEEMEFLLQKKLQEEVSELIASGAIEEIADILEVIYALLDVKRISQSELESLRLDKKRSRGGFSKGYVLIMNEE